MIRSKCDMNEYVNSYNELFKDVYEKPAKYKETELANFVAMKGARFDENQTIRFMLVGRATNGWDRGLQADTRENYSKSASQLFLKSDRFHTEWNLKDMDSNPYSEYIDQKDGKKKTYYLSKSAFWSSSKNVWCKLNGIVDRPDWLDDIAWSNIYKIAPKDEGNPSTRLIYTQAKACVGILKAEIDVLKPTHILLAIDKSWISWKSRDKIMFDFMEAFDDPEDCQCSIPQNQEIVQKAFKSKGIKVVVTCRPEKVSRNDYADAVYEMFLNM